MGGGGAGDLHFIKKANLLAEAPNGTVNTIRRPAGQPDRAGLVGPVGGFGSGTGWATASNGQRQACQMANI